MAKGFGNLMRQAQQMQKQIAELQEGFKSRMVEGEAGQGKAKATVTLAGEVKSVWVDVTTVDPQDTGMMEDLITVAVNDALTKARAQREEEMGKITGGMAGKFPGLL